MRHLALGQPTLKALNDLRGPMSLVLDFFVRQQHELAQYKQLYGELPPELAINGDRNQGAIANGEAAEDQ